MLKKDYLKIKTLIRKAFQEIENDVLGEGGDITSADFRELTRLSKKSIVEAMGFSLAEYEAFEEEIKKEKKEDLRGFKGDRGDSIKGDKGDRGDSIKGDKGDNPTKEELLKEKERHETQIQHCQEQTIKWQAEVDEINNLLKSFQPK